MRQYRKEEHIENFFKSSHKNDNLFDDVVIDHRALSALDWEDIDARTTFLGRSIGFPYMINAITGGTDFANEINKDLAKIAAKMDIPMAVGSQKIAIDSKDSVESFKLVREENPDGIIIGNLSALRPIEEVLEAIQMINADAFQLHLNMAQELVMKEGDRDFSSIIDNIKEVVKKSPVPIIVKEVGMGVGGHTASVLYDLGVRYIDIAGKGGSNFIEIEALRNSSGSYNGLLDWGIPTAQALYEVADLGYEDLIIISSGGITDATEIAKSIAMGASMTAASGEIINYLLRGDYSLALNYLENLKNNLKIVMMLTGSSTIEELSKVEYKLVDRLYQLTR